MVWILHLDLNFTTFQSKYEWLQQFTNYTGSDMMDAWLEEWLETLSAEWDEEEKKEKNRASAVRRFLQIVK
ncbi:MAG: hypothetical protein VX320_02060 [Candidatus Thermoplasmatota archaeon]|nr:hypothetical protein [Candidatus Thermoplasmatota archaeon]